MKKVVELVVNKEALENMVKKSTAIEILANGYTVPAMKRTTTTNDDGTKDVKEVSANVRVTAKMLGLNVQAINDARDSIVHGFKSGIKAMCDIFSIPCTEEQLDSAKQMLDKQFRMTCNQKTAVAGVMYRNKVLTLDAIYPVILRVKENDFDVEQWESASDYNAASKTPVPCMKWSPIKPIKPAKAPAKKDGAKA